MYLKIYTLSLSSLIIVHNTIKEGASMKVVYILMLWFGVSMSVLNAMEEQESDNGKEAENIEFVYIDLEKLIEKIENKFGEKIEDTEIYDDTLVYCYFLKDIEELPEFYFSKAEDKKTGQKLWFGKVNCYVMVEPYYSFNFNLGTTVVNDEKMVSLSLEGEDAERGYRAIKKKFKAQKRIAEQINKDRESKTEELNEEDDQGSFFSKIQQLLVRVPGLKGLIKRK
jgi:hypothetical protein